MNSTPSLPGVSRLVVVATPEFPRHSEGDMIELADGRLLLAWGRKKGASDYDTGALLGAFSTDSGLTWDDAPHLILEPWDDVTDVMSISLCRSPRGVHLFFLGRGPEKERDTRVYQIVSTDEGRSWSTPQRVSFRPGYHVMNNARVVRTNMGRLLAPIAYSHNFENHTNRHQIVFCLYSDDDGVSWQQSEEASVADVPLREPGVAQCADGSIYLTIRTDESCLYEARSQDNGLSWSTPQPTDFISPSAPSTVMRDPTSDDLWMFWCANPQGGRAGWPDRNPQALAISRDNGHTWSTPRFIENDPNRGFGYISVDVVKNHVHLTYYDWSKGNPNFYLCNLRQRIIPLAWFREAPTPPVFRKSSEPILQQDQPWEGQITSAGSGLLREDGLWKLWYTNGRLNEKEEVLRLLFAESEDSLHWRKPIFHYGPVPETNIVLPESTEGKGAYLASVHREGESLVMFAWYDRGDVNGMHRFVSSDGIHFKTEPDRPLFTFGWKTSSLPLTGAGHTSNDAFSVLQNPDGSYTYFAAEMVEPTDPRTVVAHDNARSLRYIARADSRDGIEWTATKIILRPDYEIDPWDTQFYGMHVFVYRGLYLGILFTYFVESQTICPEWAWSRDGWEWNRTRTRCIPLGNEGAFDCRMIVFGDIEITNDEVVFIYNGSNWRHNAFQKGEVSSSIGRASLPLCELDSWIDALNSGS